VIRGYLSCMRALSICALCLVACGESPTVTDASITDAAKEAAEWCDGDIKSCCSGSCDNDVGMRSWICVDGVRTCPAGAYSDVECKKKNPCMQIFCALPQVTTCVACDGGASSQATCDADAGHYVCPAGSYLEDFLPSCSDAAAD